MTEQYDIAVIGAGIAGASIAAELAKHARVLIAEAEDMPGYHTTGRSAAFFHECYGGPEVAPLSVASGPPLRELGVLAPRGSLYIARADDAPLLEQYVARFAGSGAVIEREGRAQIERRIPGLRPEWTQALYEPACADIDVAAPKPTRVRARHPRARRDRIRDDAHAHGHERHSDVRAGEERRRRVSAVRRDRNGCVDRWGGRGDRV